MHDGFYSKTVKLTDRYLRILKNTTSCELLIELPLLLGTCDTVVLMSFVLIAIINHVLDNIECRECKQNDGLTIGHCL